MDQGPTCTIGDWRPQPSFRHVISSSEQLERLNEVGAIAIDFLPTSQHAKSHILLQEAQSRTFCCWMTNSSSGFLSVPKHDADVITIRFVVGGRMIRRNGRQEHIGLPDTAMFVAFKDMRNEEASESFKSFGGTISRGGLIHGHRALEGSDIPVPELLPVVPATTPAMRAFAHSFTSLMNHLAAGIAMDDLWLALLEEIMVYQLLTAWPKRTVGTPFGADSPAAVERISRAIDFIEANLARPIRLEDVASAAGVSVRTLQSGFRKSKDCSPAQYIMRRRLEQVRDDLRSTYRDELAVADAARRWGFTHMGDFSRQYRTHFGYLPRESERKPYR